MQQKYDLLLRGGEVIDPSQDIRGRYDVALVGGKVALVAENIPKEEAKQVEDVSRKLVTPGLINIHGHFYHSFTFFGGDPDKLCLPNGVTTAVDAGTSGHAGFAGFRDFIIPHSQTRLCCFLNISVMGMIFITYIEEVGHLHFAEVEEAIECINKNREVILGVKIRVDFDAVGYRTAIPALELALQAAEKTKTPAMVHASYCPGPVTEVIKRLRPGDILPHCLNHDNIMLDANRKIRPEVRDAVERGVIFDVAHGMHLNHNLVRTALEQGFMPDVLSDDITAPPTQREKERHPWMFLDEIPTLPDVMSIFLAMGLSLEQVVRCNTVNAVSAAGLPPDLGSLRPGAAGDVAVFELQEGNFTWTDFAGIPVQGKQKLVPVMTIREGKVWHPSS